MACENSFKTVRVAFPGEGSFMDHFLHAEDGSIERLIAFLSASKGVIVGLDGLSDEEIQLLKMLKRDAAARYLPPATNETRGARLNFSAGQDWPGRKQAIKVSCDGFPGDQAEYSRRIRAAIY